MTHMQTTATRAWPKTTLVVAGLAIAMLVTNGLAAAFHNPIAALIVGPSLSVGLIALYIWVGRRIEKRPVVEFERGHGARHLLIGTVIGVGLAVVTIGILALFGAYQITGWGSFGALLAVAGTMCAVAVSEEVFFRGVLLRLIRRRWGVTIALAVSAVLFGLVHLLNPDASLWGALAITIEAGLMLGAAYLATGSLWLAIGMHFGWNVAITGIFGAVTSGSEARASLVTATTSGPDWLSGGAFGPEGSIVAILACSVMTVLLLVAAHRRGRLVRA